MDISHLARGYTPDMLDRPNTAQSAASIFSDRGPTAAARAICRAHSFRQAYRGIEEPSGASELTPALNPMARLASPAWSLCSPASVGWEDFRATRKAHRAGTRRLRSRFVAPGEVRGSLRSSLRSRWPFVEGGEGTRVMEAFRVLAGLIEEELEGSEVVVAPEESVELNVTNLGNNTRRVEAKIAIQAPLEAVWGVLTDYDHLADHIPGLAESRVLELRPNGARLLQIGQKNLALGVKFKAKAIVEVTEEAPQDLDDGALRDISFVTVEGDFNVFKGTWRMHQMCGSSDSETKPEEFETYLSYILEVQPKRWMPVALIEGVLGHEITCNLISIRNVALRILNNSL